MYFEIYQGPYTKGWQAGFGPHDTIWEPLLLTISLWWRCFRRICWTIPERYSLFPFLYSVHAHAKLENGHDVIMGLYMRASISTRPFCSHARISHEMTTACMFHPCLTQIMQWHRVHSQGGMGGGALQYQMDMGVRLTLLKAVVHSVRTQSQRMRWGVIGWEAKFWFKIRGHLVRMLLLIFQWVL